MAASAALKLHNEKQAGFDKNNFYDIIFKYTENSKATLLFESLLKYNPSYKESVGIPDSILIEEDKIVAKIETLREQIYGAQQKNDIESIKSLQNELLIEQRRLSAFEENLSKKYPDYKSNKEKFQQITTIKNVKKSLKDDELLVEYFITDSTCYIFYLTKDLTDVKIIEKHSLSDFRELISNLRNLLTDINYAKQHPQEAFQMFQYKAFKIYETYLSHPVLSDKKNLIIIPDRELNYIPFEILLSKKTDFKNQKYDSLPYLINTHNIRYEYSSTVMTSYEKSDQLKGNGRIMGFAPEYEKQINYDKLSNEAQNLRTPKELLLQKNLSNLEGAKKELEILKNKMAGDYFFGIKATEKNFKSLNKKEYSVVHLAMHGIVDLDKPNLSSLVFTENLDSLNDNLLYSYEINQLDFSKVELVVLSACQTGYGKYELGEGVVSLGRSFMHAGTSSIISTLWELNDQSAVEIMKLFYQNLSNGLPKNEALRKAKLEYLKKNPGFASHPFFWAGVIQFGDPSPIKLSYNSATYIYYIIAVVLFSISTFGIWYYFKKRKENSKQGQIS